MAELTLVCLLALLLSSPASPHFPPLLQSQVIGLDCMFDPEVVLASFLVGRVECGIATSQKFADVRPEGNSFPCTMGV